jgi:hypothetical protein
MTVYIRGNHWKPDLVVRADRGLFFSCSRGMGHASPAIISVTRQKLYVMTYMTISLQRAQQGGPEGHGLRHAPAMYARAA